MNHKEFIENYYEIANVEGVSKEAVDEFRKMLRREKYSDDREQEHTILCPDPVEEYNFYEYDSDPFEIMLKKIELALLKEALEKLKKSDKFTYNIMIEYYFSSDNINYDYLAKKYNISTTSIFKKIHKGIEFLRSIMMEW